MMVLGILAGLGAAFSQAASYLFSRHFVTRIGRSSVQLLVISHLWMALFSLLILPFVYMPPLAGWGSVVLPLLGTAGCYFLGQAAFFWTVKQIPASRVAPLLGVKIIFMGIFSVTIFRSPLTGVQWAGVAFAGMAALLLSRFGEALKPKVVIGLGLACSFFALSDLCIPLLMVTFDPQRGMRATLFSVTLDYTFCGLFVLPAVLNMRRLKRGEWFQAIPFALAWYLGMAFFFTAISLVGVVLAVILQSTRGIISIGVGRYLATTRHLELEQSFGRGVLARQLAAATLMCVAIAIFIIWR